MAAQRPRARGGGSTGAQQLLNFAGIDATERMWEVIEQRKRAAA